MENPLDYMFKKYITIFYGNFTFYPIEAVYNMGNFSA